ncbi:PBSX family phage terminase large subunit [Leuconostoc gelidum subsp. gasicomitatum]|uniref:PBSX family phage terminase large subunit n=1 Tax=Leuconostoc gasicomitatum TaxID=115778 RepID=UPI001CC73333|nr:PBSX family phage terminase large subunit [Leuconostoc gasicomitatum]MBZ5943924.1 PBSX family phage terminase large subunit [Leuconostoc gasicomitatum]MBZ5973033.1 PBSX family phage terminase large subunit [Leuconostoc gasicomitatum]
MNVAKLVNPAFDHLWETNASNIIEEGGRASTKSSAISMYLAMGMMDDADANVVCYRKVAGNLKRSVYEQIKWALDELHVSWLFRFKTSPMEIIDRRNGSGFYFSGVDDPSKQKSFKIAKGYVRWLWFEEATEFSNFTEIHTVQLSYTRQKLPKGMQVVTIFSYNPPRNPYDWINEWVETIRDDPDFLVVHTTYLDDDLHFLSDQYKRDIEKYKKNDYDYYRWQFLGEPVGLGTNVYKMDLFQRLEHLEDLDDSVVDLYFSADVGHSVSATTVGCYGVTYNRNVVLLDTWYYSPDGKVDKMPPSKLTIHIHDFVEGMYNKYGKPISAMTIDGADGALRNEYHDKYDVDWKPVAKLTKVDMIDRVQNLLGQGRFYYLPTENNLEYFIPEHQRYQWDEKTLKLDKPEVIKVADHTCDAFQYFVRSSEKVLKLAW